jgi:hypothetical protein
VLGTPQATFQRVEAAVAELEKTLLLLAAAGVLAGLSLALQEGEETVRVVVRFDPDAVDEYEETDLSAVRLIASAEAEPALEVLVVESALSRTLVNRLLPQLSAETLACCQVRWQGREPEADLLDEAIEKEGDTLDEYDDDDQSGGLAF